MVLGLLTVHLAGLIVFAYTCFGVGSGTLAFHIGAGLIAVMLVVFAHTMSYFYLVAMTSMMRKALAGESGPPVLVDDPRGPELLARSRRLKSSAVVWAMGGMTLPMAAFILGGGAHTRAFPAVIHTAAGYLVFAFAVLAMVMVGLALRQNRIMEAFQAAVRGGSRTPPLRVKARGQWSAGQFSRGGLHRQSGRAVPGRGDLE